MPYYPRIKVLRSTGRGAGTRTLIDSVGSADEPLGAQEAEIYDLSIRRLLRRFVLPYSSATAAIRSKDRVEQLTGNRDTFEVLAVVANPARRKVFLTCQQGVAA